MSAPTLRPYQRDAIEQTCRAFFSGGINRSLVHKPTGTGKTVMFAALPTWPELSAWLEGFEREGSKQGATMLVIAHRDELLRQAQEKIQRANPGKVVTIEQGELRASRYSDVVIASIQTLAARGYRRLERLLLQHRFRIVIVDEAHHAAAASYRTVLSMLGFLPPAVRSVTGGFDAPTYDDVIEMERALQDWDTKAPKDRLLIGVTATPNRTDAIGLSCVFSTIAYSYALKQAITDGWLVPIVPWVIETSQSLDAVRSSHGDLNQKDLAEAVNTPWRNKLAVDSWKLHAADLSTIAFTVDVQHAHDLAAAFHACGVEARAVSGETDKEERRQILRDFAAGKLQVVTNCMVLTEGTDLPIASCILHAKPTKSASLYEQMTGRGLRIHPGKTRCVVIDLVDVAKRHSLQSAPILYGLPPGLNVKGEDLRKVADDLDALRERFSSLDVESQLQQHRFTVEELRDRASTFDVWAVPSMGEFAADTTLNWIRQGDVFSMGYRWGDGFETLKIAPDMLGHFEVVLTLKPAAQGYGQRPTVRQRTIGAQLPTMKEALALAEVFVMTERRSITKLMDRAAPWRARPASEAQLGRLAKMRVPAPKGCTMGQASDLIDLSNVRRAR